MASKKSSVLGVACLAWGLLVAAPAFAGFRASGTYRRPVNCLTRMAEPQGASDSNSGYELWVDFRLQRLRKPLTSWGQPGPVSPAVASLQSPKVKEGLIDLANNLKEKFNKIGVELPKGKIMNGVVIDKKFAKEVLEEVRDMQIPVFTARKEVQGERMEGNSFFLCKAADGKPVACLEPKQIRLSSVQPHAAEDVYSLESDDVKADREKEEADYMERYREGLKDPSKYVLPPRSRMRELFGLPPEPRKPDRSRLLAKTIPPDALLWGRALMDRQRRGKVGYNLKSEVKNVAEAIAVTKVVDNQS